MVWMRNSAEWCALGCVLCLLALMVPPEVFSAGHPEFLLIVGGIGLWRYGVGLMHYFRGIIFCYIVFPYHRKKAKNAVIEQPPSHIYLMVTSFRIDAMTTAMVYRSVIKEAIDCGYPSTIVASIVELSDELLINALWEQASPPKDRVKLLYVRIPGTGKRDGLANGFRAIARDMPDANALVAVVDGE